MNSYKDLEIYKTAYRLAIEVHRMNLSLPKYELHFENIGLRDVIQEYEILGAKINKLIQYVETSWNKPATRNP